MIQQILSAYDLDENQFDIEPINNGLINQTWRLKNSYNDYILQKINSEVFKRPPDIASNLKVLAEYLFEHAPNYLFIVPLQTKKKEGMTFLPGKGYFRLLPFVKKSHTISAAETPGQAFEAAKEFGKFSRLLAHFPVEKLQITLPDFHNLSMRYRQFSEALIKGNTSRIKESKELIRFIRGNKNIVETYERILKNPEFRLRVTHHDTKISNVLFDEEDKGLCVIDLDTVMAGYFISDVGDMLRTYLSPVNEEEKDFSKIEIRDDYFIAIAKGYMNEMNEELSIEEKSNFIYAGEFMIYMQAIRFLTDYLCNDVYYGAAYKNQNLVRAGNQITLLQKLMNKGEMLQKLFTN
ncbi:MAG: aminoglycoside phosphotransferase family protein [Bacteroidota bacterium]|nr:aminoglycoside phosphotransferase family protein [Bacteroidota bacterium]